MVRQHKVTPLGDASYIRDEELTAKIKKKRRRGLTRRLVVFFVCIGVSAATMTHAVSSQKQEIHEKQQEKAKMEKKLAHLKQQGHKFEGQVKKLHDPEYIGQVARRDYFMTKDGEVVFRPASKQ